MKGIFDEYGTLVVSAIIGLLLMVFLIDSASSPEGALHKFAVVNMENMGAETQVVVEEWKVDDIQITLKDNGGLYFSGSGTLPAYTSVEETPWASKAKYIDFVKVADGVSVSGEIPIK